jgi:hypothetical protein
MRQINIHILWSGGITEWLTIPWGKAHLDYIRRLGGTIIGYHDL